MSDERIRTARKMIKQGRYDHAKEILDDIDDPMARALLEQLETAKATRGGFSMSTPMMLMIGSVALLVVVIVIAVSGVLNDEDEFNDEYASWDRLSIELVNYCDPIMGDVEDACLDWANYLLGNIFEEVRGPYYDAVEQCLGTEPNASLENPDLAAAFGECIAAAAVPEPGTQPQDEEEG